MNGVDPKGIDGPFRQHWFNMIKARLQASTNKSCNPAIIKSIDETTKKFEAHVYDRANNKQEYIHIIDQKFAKAMKVSSELTTGNRSNFGEQNLSMTSSQQQPSQTVQQFVHQNNGQVRQQNDNFGHQNAQFGQQNDHFGQQSGQFRQHNVQFGQPLVNPPLTLQYSQPQYSRPVVNPQVQGNQYRDSRVPVSEMSGAYFRPQNNSVENRPIPQSNMPSTTVGSAALSSLSNAGDTNSDQFQRLAAELQRAKSCLPELLKWYKNLQAKFGQAQTDGGSETCQKLFTQIQRMIKFLQLQENQLMLLGEDKLRYYLNLGSQIYNQILKPSGPNQVHQLSLRQTPARTNVAQNPQTGPSPMNKPLVSSPTINSVFSSTDSSPASSRHHGSSEHTSALIMKNDPRTTRSPEGLQSVKRKQAMCSNSVPFTNNSTYTQPEEENDFTKFVSKVATNASANLPEETKDPAAPNSKPPTTNAKRPKKPCAKPREKSSGSAQDSWLDLATKRSISRPSKLSKSSIANNEQKMDTPSISQSRTSVLSVDTPLTPITPCSVPNGNGSETETVREEINFQDMLELADQAILVGSPETLLASPLVTECPGPDESTQQPAEKLPIDRLMDAVKACSKETLKSAVNDMRAAVMEMDELPGYAYLEDDYDTVAAFIDSYRDDYENEEDEQPNKKLKRDIESVSMNASFPLDTDDFTDSKQASALQPNQMLVDEINDTNEKLYWTVMRVVTNSSDQSDGTIVRCTYRPFGVRPEELRSMFAVDSIYLAVDILVPVDYPSSPPKILDCKLPAFGVSKEMAEKTKSMFDTQVRCVEPLRVAGMGEAWDLCARSVFIAYVKHCGSDD